MFISHKSMDYLYFLFCSCFYTFSMVVSYLWVHHTHMHTRNHLSCLLQIFLAYVLLFNFFLHVLKCSNIFNILVCYFIFLLLVLRDYYFFGTFYPFDVHIVRPPEQGQWTRYRQTLTGAESPGCLTRGKKENKNIAYRVTCPHISSHVVWTLELSYWAGQAV